MAITAGLTKDFLEKWYKETSHLVVPYNKIVPVKKYEPRMFMGREVPEGATHYLVDQNGNYSWLAYLERDTHNPSFYQDGFWYGLPYDAEVRGPIHKLPKQESQKSTEMKELTLQDLDDGIIITMPDNSRYKLQRTNFTIDISEWSDVFNKLKITLEGCPQPIIKQPTQPKAEQEKNMSELFGKKYKVTEETITLLLNALMTQGSDILGIPLSSNQLYVYEDGHVSHGSKLGDEYFANHRLPEAVLEVVKTIKLRAVIHPKSPEQLAYEQLQAQIADEETRHSKSMKALRERAEKLKPKQ